VNSSLLLPRQIVSPLGLAGVVDDKVRD